MGNMLSWQSLLFDLLIAVVFLSIVSIYGYYLQSGFSVGGLVLSWNFDTNYVVTLLLPPLLVTITAITLVSIDKSWLLPGLWLTSLFIFLFRTLLITVTQRLGSIRTADWLSSGLLSILLAFLVTRLAIYAQASLRLSPQTAAVLIWSFGLLAFLYVVHELLPRQFGGGLIQRQFIGDLYVKFYAKFHTELNKPYKDDIILHRLFFAILITEDMNRPAIFRFFERLVFPLGFIGTTGIMQVMNKEKLTDEKSIDLAQKLITGYYHDANQRFDTEYMRIHSVAYRYNDGDFYSDLIVSTYYTLVELDVAKGSIGRPV
jgi:hypothetical protein